MGRPVGAHRTPRISARLECLRPFGLVGATPNCRNVGGYGVEVGRHAASVDMLDRRQRPSGTSARTNRAASVPHECPQGAGTCRGVLRVRFRIAGRRVVRSRSGMPDVLGRTIGVPSARVGTGGRRTGGGAGQRRSQGNGARPGGSQTWSAGSFFTIRYWRTPELPAVLAGWATRTSTYQGGSGQRNRRGMVIERAGSALWLAGPGGRVTWSVRTPLALTIGGGTTEGLIAWHARSGKGCWPVWRAVAARKR